jgi:hypothetical protein
VLLAFGWVPFYAWLLTTDVVGDVGSAAWRPAFDLAAVLALSVNFVHRHVVYFLFFGDEAQRRRHPTALWLAPVIAVVGVGAAKLSGSADAWGVVVAVTAAWNIWHVLMQRHGVARAYAAKAGGGVDERAHGRRDLLLLWALTLVTAAGVMRFQQRTFTGLARKAWRLFEPVVGGAAVLDALVVVTALLAAVALAAWLRAERRARPAARAPRALLWLSTAALLVVFWLHGPIVGYLVFGVAHSIEYMVFVHLYSKRRTARGPEPLGVRALGEPVLLVIVSAVLLGAFVAARQVWTVPLFMVYYTSTSLLHYFYDGIVWKMRRPEVRAPLVSAPAA